MGAENEAPTIVKTCPNQPKQTQKSDCTKSKKHGFKNRTGERTGKRSGSRQRGHQREAEGASGVR